MATKEIVLQTFIENKNQTISGEFLAQKCDVSRAAIWKAINSLRNEGYTISATTNNGYIFSDESDNFSLELLSECFYTNFPEYKNYKIEAFKTIDSTNNYAKKLLLDDSNPQNKNTLIVAQSQTAGKGRLGRSFLSPQNTGIYLSIIYSPKDGIKNPAQITAFSALAVTRVIKKLFNVDSQIKWINDIFVNGKKVCGILTEGFTNFETGRIESAIIGIGCNIYSSEDFTPEVSKIAGGILSSSQKSDVSRYKLASFICGEVLKVLEEDSLSVLEEYKSKSLLIGKEVRVYPVHDQEESSFSAIAKDIDDNLALIVELPDGSTKALISGEVSLKSGNFA